MPGTKIDAPFTKYQIDWARLKERGEVVIVGGPWVVSLFDEAGDPLQLVDMQGGAFSDDGRLLYVTNGLHADCDCGIHVFEVWLAESDLPCGSGPGPCMARRVDKSTNGQGAFNFEYHPGWSRYEEPEGITYWDLDVEGAPRPPGLTSLGLPLGGQVHVLLLDNDLDADDVYLKHYRAEVTCELEPGISVVPAALDFGEVNIGIMSAEQIGISNQGDVDLTVTDLAFRDGSSQDFRLTSAPALPARVAPGGRVNIELAYAPTLGGQALAQLAIVSDDPEQGIIVVPLAGIGITLADQAGALVTSFDEAVAAGDLKGKGPGSSADKRLNALRNMLVSSAALIEDGAIGQACDQLDDALARTDGLVPPKDFVTGDAADDLAADITGLRARLGCA